MEKIINDQYLERTMRFLRPDDRNELAPCPFCGNTEIIYEQYERTCGPRWRVVCCGCMAMIDPGYAQNRYQVAALWNKRQGGEKNENVAQG